MERVGLGDCGTVGFPPGTLTVTPQNLEGLQQGLRKLQPSPSSPRARLIEIPLAHLLDSRQISSVWLKWGWDSVGYKSLEPKLGDKYMHQGFKMQFDMAHLWRNQARTPAGCHHPRSLELGPKSPKRGVCGPQHASDSSVEAEYGLTELWEKFPAEDLDQVRQIQRDGPGVWGSCRGGLSSLSKTARALLRTSTGKQHRVKVQSSPLSF